MDEDADVDEEVSCVEYHEDSKKTAIERRKKDSNEDFYPAAQSSGPGWV